MLFAQRFTRTTGVSRLAPFALSLVQCIAAVAVLVPAQNASAGRPNLLLNRGFEDLDGKLQPNPETDGTSFFGDFFNRTGAGDFNNFFGPDAAVFDPVAGVVVSPGTNQGHASFFGDRSTNVGSIFQTGIPAAPGQTFQFDLLDTLVESDFSADLTIGIEFFADDDTTSLGSSSQILNTDERVAVFGGANANGQVFSFQSEVAPAGTAFVRPFVSFDNVDPSFPGPPPAPGQPNANVFVFEAHLSEVPAPGGNLLRNPQFAIEEGDRDPGFGDGDLGAAIAFGTFGNAQINNFFGDDGPDGDLGLDGVPNAPHASLFGDNIVNDIGGIFQQGILTEPGTELRFTLEDVLIEENFDANLFFGIEFHGSNDADGSNFFEGAPPDLIPDTIVEIDTTAGEGLSFSVDAVAPEGAVFARPIVFFNGINSPVLPGDPDTAVFIFDTSLVEIVDGQPGDFNGDGVVDAADFAAFRDGQSPSPGALADFQAFVDNFGAGDTAAVASTTAVPEPASCLLIIGAASALLVRSRKD